MLQKHRQPFAGRFFQERARIAVVQDFAPIDKKQARSHVAGEVDFVRDHNHGHALGRQLTHDLQHFVAQFRVQRRGRFIEEHQFWRNRQRPRNRHALLLTAGQLPWVVSGAFV